MRHKLIRIVIGVPAAFNALSAIGGGIALLAGTYKDGVLIEAGGQARFPLEWLQGTPFSDYTIPALILTIGVGGSSLIAATLVFTGRARAYSYLPWRDSSWPDLLSERSSCSDRGSPGLKVCTLDLVWGLPGWLPASG